jgi:hypothetical protein
MKQSESRWIKPFLEEKALDATCFSFNFEEGHII